MILIKYRSGFIRPFSLGEIRAPFDEEISHIKGVYSTLCFYIIIKL